MLSFVWPERNNTNYVDDLAFLTNILVQAESLLHSLEQAAGGNIGLYMNANKTEFMCFEQKGAISTLSGKPLKLEDWFTNFGINISSTESDVNIHIGKA